ncbi:MAG: hypothetical protein HY016_08310 [Nitrosomonadales bacterium]|nr:hypothetical protein [Nitrosomonadales bacterium]
MNRKELAAMLGVTPTAIGHWENEGMPVITKAGKGSPNDYSLDDCLAWLRRTGKGQSVRVDRPGAATRVNALMQAATNNDAPSETRYLTLTEKQIEDAIIFGETQGQIHALHWVAEHFQIAAAAIIRFGGMEQEDAVNLGVLIASAFQSVYCISHNIEKKGHGPESRVGRWRSLDKEALAELAAQAVKMQSLWDQDGVTRT